MLKPYNELVKIDVTPYCEYRETKDDSGKKINVPYLNWAKCKDLLHENGAETVYFEPMVNSNGSSLFMADMEFTDKNGGKNRCYEVRVKVHIDGNEWEMQTPLMNGSYVVRDDTLNQLRVANAQARAFVKCVAIHTGLGFHLWLKDEMATIEKTDIEEHEHSLKVIKQRVEKLYAKAVQYYGSEDLLLKNLNSKKSAITALLVNLETVAKFEDALKQIVR